MISVKTGPVNQNPPDMSASARGALWKRVTRRPAQRDGLIHGSELK
jgi:hypothetical protein